MFFDVLVLLGMYNCVGRQLALMELRYILAYTVWNYKFSFAPDEDGRRISEDAMDLLILKAGKLDLTFTKRGRGGS